jgi:hypothetical protein
MSALSSHLPQDMFIAAQTQSGAQENVAPLYGNSFYLYKDFKSIEMHFIVVMQVARGWYANAKQNAHNAALLLSSSFLYLTPLQH